MSEQGNMLYDIQHNTSEFNIKFHMKEIIGIAMVSVFKVPENKRHVESTVNIEITPIELLPTIVGAHFGDLVDQYLKSGSGVQDDFYDGSRTDNGAEEN